MKTKVPSTPAALKRRIRQFYRLLNEGDFERCHAMIDPRIRQRPSSVTLLQYAGSLEQFLAASGPVKVVQISVDLHAREPSALYEGRDFALGTTRWEDAGGREHTFAERWVREGRTWYTRCTGLVVPDGAANNRRKRA